MPFDQDPFDDAVFGALTAPRSARASMVPGHEYNQDAPERQRMDLDALIAQSYLSFSSLMAADKAARVHAIDRGSYRVELGNQRLAFDMSSLKSLLEQDNEGIDLSFSDDLASYEPEPGLVRKSKIPLWILKPLGGNTVVIKRVW